MLVVTASHLDIESYRFAKHKPAGIINRNTKENWCVRQTDTDSALSPRHLWTTVEDHVHIPVHQYTAPAGTDVQPIGLGISIGCTAVNDFYADYKRQFPDARIIRLHLVLGHEPKLRGGVLAFWVGFAFLVEGVRFD
jgi:hypothetical protein